MPELLLAIKKTVDEDGRPGRFLLTGSANVLTLPKVADSLAGRMKTLRMLPLARAVVLGRPSAFLEKAFAGKLSRGSGELAGILALASESMKARGLSTTGLAEQIKLVAGRGFEPLTFRL